MKQHQAYFVKHIVLTGVLAAVATILMYLEFPVPFMPSFVKFDISELPALIASFVYGPIEGVAVCLIKNLLKLPTTMSGGVGELSNFFLGISFVIPAGLLYRLRKNRKSALIGSIIGACLMALISLPLNYFVVYPAYTAILPLDAIIGMYQELNPHVNGLFSCLLIFNFPFTLVKGLVDTLLTFLIYKHISRFFH